jgi:glyoxylase-like metal-dependent hydrolase (beta-lactamase superfamily II)|tara:strand:+ start:574 stop:1179 length:606 start_codon:yes stop_codon:yes gene_type:complete
MDEILKDVYTWSVFSEEKKLNFNGYFIPTQHALFGNVVIDPPPVSDLDLAQMETLGSVQQILITNRNHIRWSRELQEKFDAEIRMNFADAQSEDMISDHNFSDGDMLAGFLKAVVIPDNKSPGETALYWEEKKILFLGDALIGKPPGEVSLLPPEKYADIEKARSGIKVLDPLNFNSVLMGDGEPVLTGGKKAIERFFNKN